LTNAVASGESDQTLPLPSVKDFDTAPMIGEIADFSGGGELPLKQSGLGTSKIPGVGEGEGFGGGVGVGVVATL
jgi:hypothetical protein